MGIELNWFLPNHGDGRHLIDGAGTSAQPDAQRRGQREPDIDYLVQVAQAAEYAGLHAVLIPTGAQCEDGWLVASALAQETERLRFLVAFRPGLELPAYAAQKAAALQTFSGNRLLLNVVTGGNTAEQQAYGDFLDHDARYARTDEFLHTVQQLWRGPRQNHTGTHYRVENGGLIAPLAVRPPIYFGGASAAAEAVAARHSDVYLLWGETPAMIAERVARVQRLAEATGRTLRFGLRLHVIARATEAEAWAQADHLLQAVPRATIEQSRTQLARAQSVGQQRMLSLYDGRPIHHVRDLEVAPNLWAGVGLVRGGAGTALVGSYAQVAERITQYHEELGIDAFIFSGYPNLEETLRFGERVAPLLRQTVAQAA